MQRHYCFRRCDSLYKQCSKLPSTLLEAVIDQPLYINFRAPHTPRTGGIKKGSDRHLWLSWSVYRARIPIEHRAVAQLWAETTKLWFSYEPLRYPWVLFTTSRPPSEHSPSELQCSQEDLSPKVPDVLPLDPSRFLDLTHTRLYTARLSLSPSSTMLHKSWTPLPNILSRAKSHIPFHQIGCVTSAGAEPPGESECLASPFSSRAVCQVSSDEGAEDWLGCMLAEVVADVSWSRIPDHPALDSRPAHLKNHSSRRSYLNYVVSYFRWHRDLWRVSCTGCTQFAAQSRSKKHSHCIFPNVF